MSFRRIVFLLTLACFVKPIVAEMLRVGVIGQKPYVLWQSKQPIGFSVDVWRLVEESLSLKSNLVYFSDVNDALQQLERRQLDVLIGPIPITSSLAKKILFTQPYQRGELGLAVLDKNVSIWSRIQTQIMTVLTLIATALCLAGIVAFFIWRIERKRNSSQFALGKHRGMLDALWFTIVTMMGVGYGDKVPVTTSGRTLSAVWMLVGIIIVSSITAGITTFFTVASLPPVNSVGSGLLNNSHIAVYGSLGAKLVENKLNAQPRMAKGVEEAFEWLNDGFVKAIVADRVELLYYLKQHPDMRATVTQTNIDVAHYGFLFSPSNSLNYEKINVELLKLIENGSIDEAIGRWTR